MFIVLLFWLLVLLFGCFWLFVVWVVFCCDWGFFFGGCLLLFFGVVVFFLSLGLFGFLLWGCYFVWVFFFFGCVCRGDICSFKGGGCIGCLMRGKRRSYAWVFSVIVL